MYNSSLIPVLIKDIVHKNVIAEVCECGDTAKKKGPGKSRNTSSPTIKQFFNNPKG